MSQAYIHACERAELLGLAVPSEEEWKETQRVENENAADEDDNAAIQVITIMFRRTKGVADYNFLYHFNLISLGFSRTISETYIIRKVIIENVQFPHYL